MSGLTAQADLERFKGVISRQAGLWFDDAKLGFLGEVLQRRLNRLGQSCETYLWELEHRPPRGELAALARELTVGETYFFRNNEQFQALAALVLRAQGAPRRLRLLSAGCASGEEPYSLAILCRETLGEAGREVAITAVDLNPAALEKAARAHYSAWALRETSAEIQRRWFRAEGGDMVLDASLREAVHFSARNLASEDAELWRPASYDAVFCRNVLMYFTPEQMRAAIGRIARSLVPGGLLFLGHAETLRGVSDGFHLRHTHGAFYYERREGAESVERQWAPQPVAAASLGPPLAVAPALGTAWVEEIARASARVAALVAAPPNLERAPALDLLDPERLARRPAEAAGAREDPDVLLLEATMQANSGQLASAEATCLRLLEIDELNAGAHYVLALCREHAGDREGAGEHDRVAVYLDPAFAMPRLHLGLLARRAGDREAARRELAHALVLIRQEDSARLLLFGGGFNREALIALCEAALRDKAGRP